MSLTRKPSDSGPIVSSLVYMWRSAGLFLFYFLFFYFRLDGDGTGRKSKHYILGFLRFVSTFSSFLVSPLLVTCRENN